VLYREAGVDIDAMDAAKRRIGRICRSTYNPQVLSEVGLFGSLFRMPQMREPVLVGSCDSVGTKVMIAGQVGRLDTIGMDIVNHSVNDILTLGAKPLFFLDYIGHCDLDGSRLAEIVKGLARACRQNNCALVGGEVAMMPDVYKPGDFDLAGFIVGAVERRMVVDARRLAPGDVAVGIPSSGLHTNGYTLARKVLFDSAGLTADSRVRGLTRPLGEELLRPHRSYLKVVYPLLSRIRALAHITGGGFFDNIRRLLPPETSCVIKKSSWRPPAIFRLIRRMGRVPDDEMYRTFNMGMGMVLFTPPSRQRTVLSAIPGSRVIGKVVRGTFAVAVI
jgi:phosphoribosylformylglycinamidine cyclo-ligase